MHSEDEKLISYNAQFSGSEIIKFCDFMERIRPGNTRYKWDYEIEGMLDSCITQGTELTKLEAELLVLTTGIKIKRIK